MVVMTVTTVVAMMMVNSDYGVIASLFRLSAQLERKN